MLKEEFMKGQSATNRGTVSGATRKNLDSLRDKVDTGSDNE
jgi:hypothetical protein